ncbi:hypothetical protein [Nostoc flagelliforme]|uniref:hypothetical protein n=1 Tax=Nostoc flagelliforme TaxID=1306274 RepID=UPI003BB1D450
MLHIQPQLELIHKNYELRGGRHLYLPENAKFNVAVVKGRPEENLTESRAFKTAMTN